MFQFTAPPCCIRKTRCCAAITSALAAVFCSLGGGSCFAVRFWTDIQLLTSKLDESVYLSKSAVNSNAPFEKNYVKVVDKYRFRAIINI